MVMLILEKAPASLKGELSRYLMEPKSGVFLGYVSALVREALWDVCKQKIGQGGAILIHPWLTEQGFRVRSIGTLSRLIVNVEGLYVARKPREVLPIAKNTELL